jgi:hypothetical protein
MCALLSRLDARIVAIIAVTLPMAVVPAVHAQPAYEKGGVSVAGGDLLDIGSLLQTDGYFERPQGDGFRARSTRLRLGGEAKDLQYVVQTDFSSSSVLLDAFTRLPLTDRLRVTAGLFKTPFSAELLTPRPDVLFAERARVVNNTAPGRQAGVTLRGTLIPDRLTVTGGAFNGTPGLQPNDNDFLLYAGRLDGRVPLGPGILEVGANAAYSIDDGIATSGRSAFSGRRVLYGVDARLDIERWMLAGEVDGASLDPDDASTASPFGFYVAGGATIQESHQVRARFDQYDPDVPAQTAPDDQLTVGYNYEPSSLLRVLLNYQAPTTALGEGFVTARLQVAIR